MLGLLLHLNREMSKTIVLITHNGAITQLGHRVAHIRDGAIHSIEINDQPRSVEHIEW